MAGLALAVQEGAVRGQRLDLRATPQTAQIAFRHLWQTVLLYRLTAAGIVYEAQAQLAAIEATSATGRLCRLEEVSLFAAPVVDVIPTAPGAKRLLQLADEQFAGLLAKGKSLKSVADVSTDFKIRPEVLLQLHDRVLQAWDQRCAITGEHHPAHVRPHPELELVAIRPLVEGGPLHVTNIMPMVHLARDAWEQGRITVTPDLDFVAVQNRLEPELLERMRRDGKLLLPADRHYWPDPAHLAYHRTVVFGR